MGKAAPDISAAIVSYNTRGLLRACLQALLDRQAAGEARLEILVVDNGSSDGSPDMVRAEFPAARVIETGENLGFGRANNAALEMASGRYFCLVNSDAEVLPGALAQTMAYLDAHPDAGLVGGQLLWPDGSPQTSWGGDPTLADVLAEQTFWGVWKPTSLLRRVLPKGRIRNSGECLASSLNPPFRKDPVSEANKEVGRAVPQICGAFMLIRREAWRQVGGFDPVYFMYNEDVDLNVRLRRAGWRVVFLPSARITHHLGASSSADWQKRARMVSAYNQSRFYYFTRFEGKAAGRKLKAYCLLGAAIRLTGWSLLILVRPAAREKVKLFREVWRQTWAMKLSGEERLQPPQTKKS